MRKPNFLQEVEHIHFVGIKGVGMTALALCIQDLGIRVTGSDVEEVFVTDEILRKRKISWSVGFRKENVVDKPDLLITTGAWGGLENPEVIAARDFGISIFTQGQAIGLFMEGKEGISVCGVGGKSTTSAMIATILDRAHLHPSFAIGVGNIPSLGTPGRYDRQGNHFVAEADEYVTSPGTDPTPKFLWQNPQIIVVTNIEHDHPDVYPNLEVILETFGKFFQKIPRDGMLFACLDNKNVRQALKNIQVPVQTYGFSPESDWFIEKISFGEGQALFSIVHKKVSLGEFVLKVPGKFNVLNATASIALGVFLGMDIKTIRQGLIEFTGTKRRFEFIGQAGGINLYDDYAHHPTEIKATLEAAREWFPKRRIIVLFQPHTFSRTKALLDDFTRSFGKADIVIFADIYASAREKKDLSVSSKLLTIKTQKYHSMALYGGKMEEVVEKVGQIAKRQDLILTMGAGDIFHYHQGILKSLKENEKKLLKDY